MIASVKRIISRLRDNKNLKLPYYLIDYIGYHIKTHKNEIR